MIETCQEYHRHTSYDRHKMSGHYLDWGNQPLVYKSYAGIEPLSLPQNIRPPEAKLSSLLSGRTMKTTSNAIDMETVSLILRLTYSLTAKARHPGGDFYYRSVASAGALYPSEIYLSARGVNNLEDGLYHFSISHHGLSLLRKGDFSVPVKEATHYASATAPALTFFFSAIFFRSAWKYRDRSYRYHLLDTAHVIENLILAFKSMSISFILTYDFEDREVSHLLGIDQSKEVPLAVCHVPGVHPYQEEGKQEIPDLPQNIREASRVSENEIDYPALGEIHSAGTRVISYPDAQPEMIHELGLVSDNWTRIHPPDPWPEELNYTESVFHRRSKRNFVRQAITGAGLRALINGLCAGDNVPEKERSLHHGSICTGFLTGGNVEEFEPGFYLLDPSSSSIAKIASGSFMEPMARICLNQSWLAVAAAHFVFMTNLDALDSIWGPRGYRYAMMAAGRLGERLYLMATAMGLGCCGIGAFYDMEAAELLGLKNASRLLYLAAIGPVKKY